MYSLATMLHIPQVMGTDEAFREPTLNELPVINDDMTPFSPSPRQRCRSIRMRSTAVGVGAVRPHDRTRHCLQTYANDHKRVVRHL